LSDREVIAEAQVNVAYRFFLDVSLESTLPHPRLLSVFRARLGEERHQHIFADVVAQGRDQGLIKDRLRLKDATPVIAAIAIPSTLRLVAQTRRRLLEAVRPFAPARVADEEEQAAQVRLATSDLSDVDRLAQRVAHLRAIVAWVDDVAGAWLPDDAEAEPHGQAVRAILDLAHKVLADRADPEAGDALVSLVDPEARHGQHGAYDTGYALDVALDADSELITAVNLLPANGDEAAETETLIAQEEEAQGNEVQALSIDGIGFRGDLRRHWQDPDGLHLDVFVPPSPEPAPLSSFPGEDFTLDREGKVLTCPGGQQTHHRTRTTLNTGWTYTFPAATCHACPLRAQLLAFVRVTLRDPGLVILDEASAHLDPATERLVDHAVGRLLRGGAAVIIAHRLTTVERAGRIVTLDAGRIVEDGPRAALARDPASYYSRVLHAGLQEALQ